MLSLKSLHKWEILLELASIEILAVHINQEDWEIIHEVFDELAPEMHSLFCLVLQRQKL